MLSWVMRLVAQSPFALGEAGMRSESVDRAKAASGFW